MQKELMYILKVVQTRSISTAAEELFISQSSLSRAIASLERDLGFAIFERSWKGIELTEEGRIFVRFAEEAHHLYQDMKQDVSELQKSRKKIIRVGMSLNAASISIKQLFEEVQKKYPDVELHVENVYSKDIYRYLKNNLLNFAVGPRIYTPYGEYDYREFFRESFCVLIPNRIDVSSLAYRKDGYSTLFIHLKDIIGQDFVMQNQDTDARMRIDRMLKDAGLKIEPVFFTTSSILAIEAAEDQIGCAVIVTAFTAYIKRYDLVKLYFLDQPCDATSGIITLKNKKLSPEEEYCSKLIQDYIITLNARTFPK